MKVKVMDKISKVVTGAFFAVEMALMNTNMAWAGDNELDIDTNYEISKDVGGVNPEGLIIGLALWISRLVGIGMLVWGVYGYVTARKDGEAESMNGALGKLISGLVLICMPSVLRALGVIS